jgi:uncharacterized protein
MDPTTRGRPVPELTDLTRPFWTAAKNRKLVMQKCGRCGALNFFPKPWCIDCGQLELEWVEVKPQGSVYSHTTAYTVMMNYPGWKAELPITLCIVELDDGPRMYGQLTGCAPENVRVGMRIEAHFADINDGAGIPRFRPLSAAEAGGNHSPQRSCSPTG